MVQTVDRLRPSAFAWSSKEMCPAATNASVISRTGTTRRRHRDEYMFKYRAVSTRVLKLERPSFLGRPDESGGFIKRPSGSCASPADTAGLSRWRKVQGP